MHERAAYTLVQTLVFPHCAHIQYFYMYFHHCSLQIFCTRTGGRKEEEKYLINKRVLSLSCR